MRAPRYRAPPCEKPRRRPKKKRVRHRSPGDTLISVYSDGASGSHRDMPGGYGWVVVRGDKPLMAGYGSHPRTTNNRMELSGAIEGLRAVQASTFRKPGEMIELVSDSQYVLGMASGRMAATRNNDLIDELKLLCKALGVETFRWVRGHSGEIWNERSDSLAGYGKKEAKERKLSVRPKELEDGV